MCIPSEYSYLATAYLHVYWLWETNLASTPFIAMVVKCLFSKGFTNWAQLLLVLNYLIRIGDSSSQWLANRNQA